MFTLRDYQKACIDGNDRYPGIIKAWSEYKHILAVLSTGCGKTIIFAALASRIVAQGGRVLILTHRTELTNQAADKITRSTGLSCAIEKAEQSSVGCFEMITVGSVQSLLTPERRSSIAPPTHIIIDECHHCISDSWQNVLAQWPDAFVAGFTATADRSDARELGTYFDSIAFEYTLPEAISQGYLSKIRALTLPLKIDLSGVAVQAGDYAASGVAKALEPYLPQIAKELAEHCRDRKLLIFAPLCATAQTIQQYVSEAGLKCFYCSGEDRSQIAAWEAHGPGCAMVNAMLLCLDLETEILTESGWVRHDTITMRHKVANWVTDGTVFFEEPKEIVKRELYETEHMVSIDSRTINLRVTDTHRMIVGCGANKSKWKKIPAAELTYKHVLPSCGVAAPIAHSVPNELRTCSRRRVSANAYNIRTLTGASFEESVKMAEDREANRNKLRRKQPSELTHDECRLIGFWIADGSANRTLIRGGVEYTLCQSPTHPKIVEWIDALLARLNVSARRVVRQSKPAAIIWSLCRGTGGGSQKRNGVYGIEPYLNKMGAPELRGLNESQFDALLEGYWYGDGHHGQAENGFPNSIVFNDTKHSWIELLCSMGPVRGWRCAMYHMPSKNPKHHDQWRLRMIKGMNTHLSAQTVIRHEHFKQEQVWCVKTSSLNIITRRHGKVVVMGNTEGYDHPAIDAVCMLRATKSRPLYAQAVGRGTRIHPGKDHLLLLDFLWMSERHQLCRPASLIAEDDDLALAMTEQIDREAEEGGEGEVSLDDAAVERARQELIEKREAALAKKLAEMRHKKRQLVDPLQYAMSIGDPALASYTPAMPAESKAPTPQQVEALAKAGIYPEEINSTGHAEAILSTVVARKAANMAQPRQVRCLERYGFKHAGKMTFAEAQEFICRISANGWRLPMDLRKMVA
jgi:superfamily II DNA or RNA helicase